MCNLSRVMTNTNHYIRVAEEKKACIKNIISAAADCDHIMQIILFGSALETRCKNYSDIDLAIISDIPKSRLFRNNSFDRFIKSVYLFNKKQSYDFLFFKSMEEIQNGKDYVCSEIANNGKTIYLRKDEPRAFLCAG